jgi:hypothetical protein
MCLVALCMWTNQERCHASRNLHLFGQKVKIWVSLIEKLYSKFKKISIASLNVLLGLFGVSSASFRSLDFWAPKKVKRSLFRLNFAFLLESCLTSFWEKFFYQVCRIGCLEHVLYSKFSQMIFLMKAIGFEIHLENSFNRSYRRMVSSEYYPYNHIFHVYIGY